LPQPLNAASGSVSSAIKIRHTVSATERLAQAHKLMGLAAKASVHTETLFNRWAKVKITDGQLKRLIQMAMGSTRKFQLMPCLFQIMNFALLSLRHFQMCEK